MGHEGIYSYADTTRSPATCGASSHHKSSKLERSALPRSRDAPRRMAPASASMEAFTALGLSETLAEAAVALGWAAPSKIQQEAVPHAVSGTYACMRV